MGFLTEYLYCLIYVSSLVFCVYQYTDKKIRGIELLCFILVYGFIDFLITGEIVLDVNHILIKDFLVIISDYIMICILNKKSSLYLLFYTTFYYTLYSETIVVVTYILGYFETFNLLATYEPSLLRFSLIVLFNVISVIVFNQLEKYEFISKKNIAKENYKVICIVNVLVLFICTVFQWFNQIEQVNYYLHIISITFIGLWLLLLHALNKSFILAHEREKEIIKNSVYNNLEQSIRQYEQNKEELENFRHDIKNHFTILKSLRNRKSMISYIDEIYSKADNKELTSKEISGNIYIDAIINSKMEEFSEVPILCQFEIDNLKINKIDLSVLLFNLIDNACLAAKEANGKVHLSMKCNGEYVIIKVMNDCRGKTDFISKRGKNHGYGMKIIEGIVEEYNGKIELDSQINKVLIKIALKV